MSDLALRLWERVHGHLGWLSAIALVHPAILLRRPRRRAPLAAWLATSSVTVVALLGAWLYPMYRSVLKQPLFLRAPSVGWLFERKEHLAIGAVALAWAGLLAHLAAPKAPDPTAAGLLSVAAHRAFVAAALLALATAAMGTVVSAWTTF